MSRTMGSQYLEKNHRHINEKEMVIVKTKNELKRAIERKQFPIKCVGELATQLTKKKKRAKKAKIVGALLALGGVAIPFSGGASAAATATGLTAMGLTVGSVAISTAELAILVGGGVAITAILKGRKTKLQPDGSVTVE